MSQESSPRRGRPPSRASRDKALRVAREILMAEGFGRLTVEAVAARAKVGKPTLYRHWSNAQELAMEALLGEEGPETPPEGLPVARALGHQLARLVAAFGSTRGRQIALALAAADPESELTRAFRNRVILDARTAGRRLLEAALARREIRAPADMEVLLDMIYAPLLFRLLTGHAPLDEAFARRLAVTALAAVAPERPGG